MGSHGLSRLNYLLLMEKQMINWQVLFPFKIILL